MSYIPQSQVQTIIGTTTDILQLISLCLGVILAIMWLIRLISNACKTRKKLLELTNRQTESINTNRYLTNVKTDYNRYLFLILLTVSELAAIFFVISSQVYHAIKYRRHFKPATNDCTLTETFANQYYSDWIYRSLNAVGIVLFNSTLVEIAILKAYLASAYRQCTNSRKLKNLAEWLIVQAVIIFICRFVRTLYHLTSVFIFTISLINWLLIVKNGRDLYTTLKRKSFESDLYDSDEEIKINNARVFKRYSKLLLTLSSILFLFILSEFFELVINTFLEGILLNSCSLFAGIGIAIKVNLSTNSVIILNQIFDISKEIREIIFTLVTISFSLFYLVIPVSYLVFKLKLKRTVRFYGTHPYRIHTPLLPGYNEWRD